MAVNEPVNDTETEEVSSKVVVAQDGELAIEYFAEVKDHVQEPACEVVESKSSSIENKRAARPAVQFQAAVAPQEPEQDASDNNSYNEPSYNQEDESEASNEYDGTFYQPS